MLRADVDNVGKKGDVLDVADGFGRNYLVPKGLAMVASKGVVSQAGAMRRSRDVKDARDRESAEVVARELVPSVIRIAVKAGAEGGSSARSRQPTWTRRCTPRPASSSTAGVCTWPSRSSRSARTRCR